MQLITRLKRWESKVERGSKPKLIGLILLVFFISTSIGFVISQTSKLVLGDFTSSQTKKMTPEEEERIESKIRELESVRYAQQ